MMNRAKCHKYLVMCEKMHKESKKELQSLLASSRPASKPVNDLIKVLNKTSEKNIRNTVKIILEAKWEVIENV